MFKDTNSRLHVNVLKHLQVKIFTVFTTNVNLTMVFLFEKETMRAPLYYIVGCTVGCFTEHAFDPTKVQA